MQKFHKHDLGLVVDFLQKGGVLAYASESVWGIGCDAFNHEAIQRVLQLKSRPDTKGLIVLTDKIDRVMPLLTHLSIQQQKDVVKMIQDRQQHFASFRQATTWLVPISDFADIPRELTGGFDSLAVRITPHLVLQRLCTQLVNDANPYGFLVSTSCNPSGYPPATDITMAYEYFGESVGYLVGESLGYDKPSQIIDLLTGQILR